VLLGGVDRCPCTQTMVLLPRRVLLLVIAALLGAAAVVAGTSQPAAGQASLESERQAADRLRDAVAAESARIADTRDGLADAERRLAALDARVRERRRELQETQDELIGSRIRLTTLQRREAAAKRELAANLVASYKAGRPQLVTIVFSSTGFADLYERLEFLKRQSESNAKILDRTREARADVAVQTRSLERLRTRYSELAKAAVTDRDRADVVRNALLDREAEQLARLDGASDRLVAVRSRIQRLQRRQAAAARQAASAATATEQAPSPTGGGGGDVVGRVVAAANQIATTPYVWGGGHGGVSGGYDCSGSLSYALAAGGLLSSPLDSTGFMSWGAPGPGSRITVYANAGHAFMVVDGRRFDTSALSGGGTRWTSEMRSTAGFVARHPPGF
jgi:cell wall-associated NlpC family hydrolase